MKEVLLIGIIAILFLTGCSKQYIVIPSLQGNINVTGNLTVMQDIYANGDIWFYELKSLVTNRTVINQTYINASQISIGGNSNVYLLETGKKPSGYHVNLSGALYINGTSPNYVGILNANPGQALDVTGAVQASLGFVTSSTSGVQTPTIKARSTNIISFQNYSSIEKMRLTEGGLGIGINTPQVKLTIAADPINTNQPSGLTGTTSTDTHTGLYLSGTGNATNEKYGMQFGNYQGYSHAGIFGVMTSASGVTKGDLTFDLRNDTSTTALTERMRITSDGFVGIGTATPQQLLHVVSTTGSAVIRANSSAGNHLDFTASSSGDAYIQAAANSNIYFGHVGATQQMVLNTTGYLGIGTTAPKRTLHIAGVGAATMIVEDTAAAANQMKKAFGTDDGKTYIGKYTDAMAYTAHMVIDNDGNVGINTVSPATTLNINGSLTIAGGGINPSTTGTAIAIKQSVNSILGGILLESNISTNNGGFYHNNQSIVIREGGVDTLYLDGGKVIAPNMQGTGTYVCFNATDNSLFRNTTC